MMLANIEVDLSEIFGRGLNGRQGVVIETVRRLSRCSWKTQRSCIGERNLVQNIGRNGAYRDLIIRVRNAGIRVDQLNAGSEGSATDSSRGKQVREVALALLGVGHISTLSIICRAEPRSLVAPKVEE